MSATERSARRSEQFLQAGLHVFAERGWAGSTVADVCRTAGLSPRYFYEQFSRREDLFLAVTSQIAHEVEQTVRAAVAAPATDPQARARAVLTALAQYFTADPRTVRVALMESLATEEFRQHRSDLLRSFSDLAARLMRSLREPAAGRRSGARTLDLSAAVLTGGVVELLIASATSGRTPRLDRLADHLTALYTAAAQL